MPFLEASLNQEKYAKKILIRETVLGRGVRLIQEIRDYIKYELGFITSFHDLE
jgi:hypothetical protein